MHAMRPEKETLLICLSNHTEVMHQALESKNLHSGVRMIFLGHLAMCARIFKSICLDESREFVDRIIHIEDSSFGLGTPNNQHGLLARESWSLLQPALLAYLDDSASRNSDGESPKSQI